MSNKIIVYFDMDGVLADFNSVYFSTNPEDNGKKFEEFVAKRGFLDLEVQQNGKELYGKILDYINKNSGLEFGVISSTASGRRTPEFAREVIFQKKLWLNKNFPTIYNYQSVFFSRYKELKQNYATPNSILIDDNESNVRQFTEAGGLGIYFDIDSDPDEIFNQILQFKHVFELTDGLF